MTQTSIPYFFMREDHQEGLYFNRKDLPEDRDQLAAVLIAAVGSGHPLNIDGIGGGNALSPPKSLCFPDQKMIGLMLIISLLKSALKTDGLITNPPVGIFYQVSVLPPLRWD